jgi:hypothetical protein
MNGGVIGGTTAATDFASGWNDAIAKGDGNQAGNGGGIYITAADVTFGQGTVIQFNRALRTSAGNGGGAVRMENAKLTLNSGSKIQWNYAGRNGGGLSLGNECKLYIRDGSLNFNEGVIGGALYISGANNYIYMWNGSINGNRAYGLANGNGGHLQSDTCGGAIVLQGTSRMEMYGGVISGNFTDTTVGNTQKGGAIFMQSNAILKKYPEPGTGSTTSGYIYGNSAPSPLWNRLGIPGTGFALPTDAGISGIGATVWIAGVAMSDDATYNATTPGEWTTGTPPAYLAP